MHKNMCNMYYHLYEDGNANRKEKDNYNHVLCTTCARNTLAHL